MSVSKKAIHRRLTKKADATGHEKNTHFKKAKKPFPGLQVGHDSKSPTGEKKLLK